MKEKQSFFGTVCQLAVPVALQSMLQSSFSIVDQVMIGQLGSVSVAGVGLASKFSSIFSVITAAVGAVAGIMIAQYIGQENSREVRRSFYLNLILGLLIAVAFFVPCALFSEQIMGIYTKDAATRKAAAEYLVIMTGTFLPSAAATLLSTLFRCAEKAKLPLYASVVSALLNTGLNYMLIFGKCGFAPMGTRGAALATVIAQCANVLLLLVFLGLDKKEDKEGADTLRPIALLRHSDAESLQEEKAACFDWRQYAAMLLPMLICEGVWSIGENVYAAIYGHMGTQASAAMTLINPIQGLMIGALCGLSQAAGVIIGKKLGSREYEEAYTASERLLLYGTIGSFLLSVVVILTSSAYVQIYQVEDAVKELTKQILLAYALVAPLKVLNMILGGGIIRSGGKTKYVMVIDMIGTWGFGVPIGLLTAFVLKLEIPYVYFLLSLEEGVRLVISYIVFRRKKWMQQL